MQEYVLNDSKSAPSGAKFPLVAIVVCSLLFSGVGYAVASWGFPNWFKEIPPEQQAIAKLKEESKNCGAEEYGCQAKAAFVAQMEKAYVDKTGKKDLEAMLRPGKTLSQSTTPGAGELQEAIATTALELPKQ